MTQHTTENVLRDLTVALVLLLKDSGVDVHPQDERSTRFGIGVYFVNGDTTIEGPG